MARGMNDPLRQSSQQANQMSAAALPYKYKAAGGDVVPMAMQTAGQAQDMVHQAQSMQMRQAESEVMLQTYQARAQLMHAELDLRQRLAPVQVQEAYAQLELAKANQKLRDFQSQYQATQVEPFMVDGKMRKFVPGQDGSVRMQDVDEDDPAMATATLPQARLQSEQDRGMSYRAQAFADVSRATRPPVTRPESGALANAATVIQKSLDSLWSNLEAKYTKLGGDDWTDEDQKKLEADPLWQKIQTREKELDTVISRITAEQSGGQAEPTQQVDPTVLRNLESTLQSMFKSEDQQQAAVDMMQAAYANLIQSGGANPADLPFTDFVANELANPDRRALLQRALERQRGVSGMEAPRR